jgi:hypothetical protein
VAVWVATEFDANMRPTGRSESYIADTAEEAVRKVLYTRQLRSGNARVGPTGRVVHDDRSSWTVTPEK